MSLTTFPPAQTPRLAAEGGLVRLIFSGVAAAFRVWNQRRIDRAAFQHVTKLDDAMLRDIGLTRGDVTWAANLPLHKNAALELQRIARTGHAM